ncbi:hypothetical protein FACS189456_6270 [Bacteroidia bacterium]|nr:hypothetical protein FACS189456_6270 [Bacteroidia bacterium]
MKKLSISIVLTCCSYYVFAQGAVVVTSAPTLEFMQYENKIETASNFAEELVQLKKMIEEARRQVAKMDSAKRGIEKTYQLQEDVRKETMNAYNAVKDMNINNIAHVTEGYLGFSINPKDHLPNMPGIEGYSDFRQSLDYDPAKHIQPNTRELDKFLSSLTLNYNDSTVKVAMNDPSYNYLTRLQEIQNLTSTYHGYVNHARLHRTASVTLQRHKAALNTFMAMADSTNSTADMIALNAQIQAMADKIDADNREIDAITEELMQGAVRAANIQDIAVRKQKDLVTITSAIATQYNVNRNFSLRRLAKARKSAETAVMKKTKEALDKKSTAMHPLTQKKEVHTADANLFARSIATVDFYSRKFAQYHNVINEHTHTQRQPQKAETKTIKIDTFVIDCSKHTMRLKN